MKIIATILLTLCFATLATAQKYSAYTVAGVQQTSPDVYTATVSIVAKADRATPIPPNGSLLRITTTGCTHMPANETAIVSDGPLGRSLLFSGGMTCKIAKIEIHVGD